MRVIPLVLATILIVAPAAKAQDGIWGFLPQEVRSTLDNQADQLHALIFGWCFEEVRGVARRSEFFDPYSVGWIDVVAENSNGSQYAHPIVSPDNAFFVDLLADNSSCWVELDSLSTPYIMQTIVAELLEISGLETVDVDESEVGRNSRRFFIPADEGGFAALMQIHASYSPQNENIVIIVRRDP